MGCEKNKSTEHDFTTDPIKLKIVGEMIHAQDTTLGADNGMAVAFAMALMDSKELGSIRAIEILLTTQEETTMAGALNVDTANLQGRMLINLDSDREGTLFVSSAGGMSAFIRFRSSGRRTAGKRRLYNLGKGACWRAFRRGHHQAAGQC